MADHGKNYTRMTGEDGKELGSLGPECGHHCGVITVGHSDQHKGHCGCPECHDTDSIKSHIPQNLIEGGEGKVNLRGIH